MAKNKWSQIGALLLAAACLAGCASTKPAAPTNPPQTQAVTASDAASIPAQIPTETAAIAEPTHVEEVIDENFSIDADIVGAPENGMAGVYTASPARLTKERIQEFVRACGNDVTSSKESDDGSMAYYTGECTNGYTLTNMHGIEGVNNHPYAEFQYSDTARHRTYYDYPIYVGEEDYVTNPDYSVGWMFTEPKEFAFASEQTAKQAARDALAVLGLTDLMLLRTLYIDHNTMAEAGKLLATDERFAPIMGEEENNGYKLRDDWSEEEDAYMFSFAISVDGVPMSYLYDSNGATAAYCGSEVIVWYTKYGITSLHVYTPWVIQGEKSAPEQLVSAQTALEVVKEKYRYDLYRTDKKVEELRLVYRYVQDRSQWLLRPTWAARVSFSYADPGVRFCEFMYVDALTGKEL